MLKWTELINKWHPLNGIPKILFQFLNIKQYIFLDREQRW
jgi:hypothetical protein